jgi:hypothetical protein
MSELVANPAKQQVQVLTIEKLVKLLSEEHLAEFKAYLAKANAQLPLKLINSITTDINVFQGNEELCKLIYGKADKQTRQSFNQLASYTLKLTSYLARNYPTYISISVFKPELMVSHGRISEAVKLMELLLDIGEKIEDFKATARALTFLSQYSYMSNAHGEGLRLQKRLNEILNYEILLNELTLYFKSNININVRENDLGSDLQKHLDYFGKYINHTCFSISAHARYFTFYINYYYNAQLFYTPEKLHDLAIFEDDLNKYGYVVMPYFTDMQSKITLFKLNHPDIDLNSRDSKKEIDKLLRLNEYFQYWKYFGNQPELYAINIKATYYLANFHQMLHLPGAEQNIPEEVRADVEIWRSKANEIHNNTEWKRNNILDLIHLRLNLSALMLLGDNAQRGEGIDLIEETLISYQQISFSESIDSYFTCLMIGYFSKKEYEKCVNTYKRYIKLTQGRKINEDNDICIHAYYYGAQWMLTGRKQYVEKMSGIYKSTLVSEFFKHPRSTITAIVDSCQIPATL